jgi:hypothetical protein
MGCSSLFRAQRYHSPPSGGSETPFQEGRRAARVSRTYRVAIIGTGRMGGLIEDEIPAGSFSKPYGHCSAYAA